MPLERKRTRSARPLMVKRTPSVKSFSFSLPDSNKKNDAKKASSNKEALQTTQTTARAESVSSRVKSNFDAFKKVENQGPKACPTKSVPTEVQRNIGGGAEASNIVNTVGTVVESNILDSADNGVQNNILNSVGSAVKKTPVDLRIKRIVQNLAQRLQSTPSFSEDDRTGSESSCPERTLKNHSPLIPHVVRRIKKPFFPSLSLSDTVFASGQKPCDKLLNVNNDEAVHFDDSEERIMNRITERSSKKSPVQHFTFPSIDTHDQKATISSSTANEVAKTQYSLNDKKSLQQSSLSVNLLSFNQSEKEKDSYIQTKSDEKILAKESHLSDASSLSLGSDASEELESPVIPLKTKQFLLSGGILRKVMEARKRPEMVYEMKSMTVKEVNPFSTRKVKGAKAEESPRPVPEEQDVFFWKPPGTNRAINEITSLEIALTVASKIIQDMRKEVSDQTLLSLLKTYEHCVEKDITALVKRLVELRKCNKDIKKVQKEVKQKSDEFGEKLHREMLKRRRRREQDQQKTGTREPAH